MCTVDEEIEALAAVYCGDREFVLVESHSGIRRFTMNLHLSDIDQIVSFGCSVMATYPSSVPLVEVYTPKLTRNQGSNLQSELLAHVTNDGLMNQPMLDVVILWVKEYLSDILSKTITQHTVSELPTLKQLTVLYTLDHMRSKSKYTKILTSWANQLNVCGRVIFCNRKIFIVLHGKEESVRKFLVDHKTQNVDVNSSGQPCKERLLQILAQEFDKQCTLSDFTYVEFSNTTDLQIAFANWNLTDLFENYVKLGTYGHTSLK